MAMTDKEQGFLEYLISHEKNCIKNILICTENILENLCYGDDPKRTVVLASDFNYYRGCMETYNDLINAYRHTFDKQQDM